MHMYRCVYVYLVVMMMMMMMVMRRRMRRRRLLLLLVTCKQLLLYIYTHTQFYAHVVGRSPDSTGGDLQCSWSGRAVEPREAV